jgi:dihydrofolate reductase
MDNNRVIGYQNRLPWHLPADLKHFRTITMGKPIIMGHKTYNSIGHPLPGRLNVILTHNSALTIAGCHILHSLAEVLTFAKSYEEIVIIGGAQTYQLLLPYVQRMYITQIHTTVKGDTHFPNYSPFQWQEIARQDFHADSQNIYPYSFTTVERVPRELI